MKIDWSTFATTKGRQVYSWTLGFNSYSPNYEGGFLVGWDEWSDGRIVLSPGLFVPERESDEGT